MLPGMVHASDVEVEDITLVTAPSVDLLRALHRVQAMLEGAAQVLRSRARHISRVRGQLLAATHSVIAQVEVIEAFAPVEVEVAA